MTGRGAYAIRALRDFCALGYRSERLGVLEHFPSRLLRKSRAFSRSTEKSWPHFRPSAVDFCCSRLAIGAATERARALAMPAGTRAQALQQVRAKARSSGR